MKRSGSPQGMPTRRKPMVDQMAVGEEGAVRTFSLDGRVAYQCDRGTGAVLAVVELVVA